MTSTTSTGEIPTLRPYKLIIQVVVQEVAPDGEVLGDGPLVDDQRQPIVEEVMFSRAHEWLDALPGRLAAANRQT